MARGPTAVEDRAATRNEDGTRAEYVPAFFNVKGDGSCWFYSVAYALMDMCTYEHPPISPESDAVPHVVHAHSQTYMGRAKLLRDTVVDGIYARLTSLLERYESCTRNECQCAVCRSKSEILSEILSLLGVIQGEKYANQKITHEVISQATMEMREDRYWADASMTSAAVETLGVNILIVSVPNTWLYSGAYSESEMAHDQSLNIYEFQRDEIPQTIFLLHTGNHFLPIFFLDTTSPNLTHASVITRVETLDRARWVRMIERYWGFPEEIVSKIELWLRAYECGHIRGNVTCTLPLCHEGPHNV